MLFHPHYIPKASQKLTITNDDKQDSSLELLMESDSVRWEMFTCEVKR